MHPGYFGPPDSQLFGIHHPPSGAVHRGAGVVLCHPGPYEYMWTHWAFRKLAAMLAREGFDVLRFDFHATGDSAGESAEASPARWRDDVKAAVSELKELSGVWKVSAVGMRLGAVAAAEASADGLSLATLVLWNPVLRGVDYLRALRDAEATRTARLLHPPARGEGRRSELLGVELPQRLEDELARLDLSRVGAPSAERVVLVTGRPSPDWDALDRSWSGRGTKLERRPIDDAASADPVVDGALLSQASLVAITSALTGGAS